jgi:predicted HD phosphohydrolase
MTPPPVFPTVTKLEAANRQLCAAIRLFFEDADAVSVHTLACAARDIYEKHCVTTNRERMFDVMKQANPNHKEKDIWTILNANRIFFKHPG